MNNNPSINDFASASAYLAKGRDKTQRTLHGRHTTIRQLNDQAIAIRYHNTDIVTYCQNGDIVLNSGGYKTVTTKRKINEYVPAYVSQNKSIWYTRYVKSECPTTTPVTLFQDGMVLHVDGTVSGTLPASDAKRQSKLVRDINTYARAYVDALFAGNVPAPSGGDCWMCSMFDGEDNSHLTLHMQEKYYVPSLIIRAFENWSPTQGDNQINPYTHLQGVVAEIWQKDGQANWMNYARPRIANALRRYMRLQFGLPSSM